MSGPSGRLDIIGLALRAGHLSVRSARMEPGKRYKIDARDPGHTVVYVAADLAPRQHAEVQRLVTEQLYEVFVRRCRDALVAVEDVELVSDDQVEATGTDGDADLEAHRRRASVRLIRGED